MFTIRTAKVADAVAMHALQRLVFEEEARRSGTREIPPLQEELPSIVQHIEHQIALVATRDEAIVGCVRGVMGEHSITIRALVVHPSCQGQGLGSMLMQALESALTRPTRIDLTTNTLMERNVPFYERHGYVVMETSTPIPGITLAHMSKHVERGA